ncbi:MAG: glycosyltransferase family 61 protein, partial [Cytophagales bacterium]|nr:glycosyltransferase family 61 protein [Cytophagales bacterium]
MEKLGTDSIQAPLPLNLKEKDAHRFLPFQTYPKEQISISDHTYVMVTRSGIVFKRFQVVPESVYVHKDRHWKYWKSAFLNFLFRKKVFLLSKEKYTLGHNYYCPGYYHWITEALPRLMALGNRVDQLILLLPEYTDPDIQRTLEIFNFKSILKVKEGTAVYLKYLVLPSQPKFGDTYDPALLDLMRQKFWEYAQSKQSNPCLGSSRIYVSRRKARARKVSNEDQVLDLLAKYGFVDVCFEDLTFFEKVVCMKNATHLV